MPDDFRDEARIAQTESRLSANEAQLEAVTRDIANLTANVNRFFESTEKSFNKLYDRINTIGSPNFGTLALWGGFIVSVIVAIGSIIGWGVSRELDRLNKDNIDLDTRLQREFNLSISRIDSDFNNADRNSRERHDQAVKLYDVVSERITVLENWNNDRIQADLEELRQWRMRHADNSLTK